ncbi:hypothetical protein CYMTET_17003 [Cymbomonas tetramitiformis]|uniref:DUF4352 domain-containing protein n=1 Tax=Cymbomonas tetramitiformis TaxID=36881 RepID=A0AAE0GCB2_9CHLO|nr:hypothetical protein CYMTET_17003 [Cymbomonas tetramitiformis]
MFFASAGNAIGPETFELTVDKYEPAECAIGAPKNGRCIRVYVTAENANNTKPAYNSEIFGRVRFSNGESALYGDFAEASDAGQLASIPEEISVNKKSASFGIILTPGNEDDPLDFVKLKARTYPGMRADFRVIAPVGFEDEECENAAYGLPCDEEF